MNPVTKIDETFSRTALLTYLRAHQGRAFSRIQLQSLVKLPGTLAYIQACELIKQLLGRLMTLDQIEQTSHQVGNKTILTYRYKPVNRPRT